MLFLTRLRTRGGRPLPPLVVSIKRGGRRKRRPYRTGERGLFKWLSSRETSGYSMRATMPFSKTTVLPTLRILPLLDRDAGVGRGGIHGIRRSEKGSHLIGGHVFTDRVAARRRRVESAGRRFRLGVPGFAGARRGPRPVDGGRALSLRRRGADQVLRTDDPEPGSEDGENQKKTSNHGAMVGRPAEPALGTGQAFISLSGTSRSFNVIFSRTSSMARCTFLQTERIAQSGM